MTTRQYLNQIDKLDRMIRNKTLEVYRTELLASGLQSPTLSDMKVQTSLAMEDSVCGTIVELQEEIDDLNRLVKKYISKRKQIVKQIDSMPNPIHYDVLTLRYVNRMSNNDISLRMKYSVRQVNRFENEALKNFEKLYGKCYLSESCPNVS